MTESTWFYLISIVAVFAFVVFFFCMKRKGSISAKVGDTSVSMSFNEVAKADPKMKQVSAFMDGKLCVVRELLRTDYLKLVKAAGCPVANLMQIESSQLVDQMLGNIVFSGNGINSIKSILQKSFLAKEFISYDDKVLHDFLKEQILENIRIYTNAHYDSEVLSDNGDRKQRLVNQIQWIDSQTALMPDIMNTIDEILSFARNLYKEEK